MSAVWAIAANTFREAIRDRILYLILFFSIAVIGSSEAVSLLAIGDRQRIVEDLSLFSIQFFGVLTCVFLGISLLSKEVERRTVYNVLSKPVSRAAFVLGKGLGLYLTTAALTASMTAVFAVFLRLRFGEFPPALWRALALFPFEYLVVAALSLLVSAFTRPLLAALLAGTLVVIGHLSEGLKLLAAQPSVAGTFRAKLSYALYYALPNLERFNLKDAAIHRDIIPFTYLAEAAGYGLAYAAAVMVLAVVVFDRRDLL